MATKGERANVVTLAGELASHRGCICKRGPVSAAHRRVVSTFVVLRPPPPQPAPNPPRPRIIDAISKICRYENRKSFFISLVGAYGVEGTSSSSSSSPVLTNMFSAHAISARSVCVCGSDARVITSHMRGRNQNAHARAHYTQHPAHNITFICVFYKMLPRILHRQWHLFSQCARARASGKYARHVQTCAKRSASMERKPSTPEHARIFCIYDFPLVRQGMRYSMFFFFFAVVCPSACGDEN